MVGEAFHEVAILVVVFAPLDRWVARRAYTWSDTWETFGLSVTIFLVGIVLERFRRV